MEAKHSESVDAPALVRRRRKVARQTRDKTPEARMLGAHKYSDEEDETTSSTTPDQSKKSQLQQQHQRKSSSSRSSKTSPLSPLRLQPIKNSETTVITKTTTKSPPLSPTQRQSMDIKSQSISPVSKSQPVQKSTSPVKINSSKSPSPPTKPQNLSPPQTPVCKNSPTHTAATPDANDKNIIQTIRMQIRPPGAQHTISAHESKILRRRNRQFAGQVARSQSQPRENENQSNEDVKDLMRSAKRSLSSTRHRDETDESGQSSTHLPEYSPLPDMQRKLASSGNRHSTDAEKLTKLERNLKRFDDERSKFEIEKKKFERDRRDLHKLRYRQLVEAEERRRMLENYRKNSGDSVELKVLPKTSQSFREPRTSESHQGEDKVSSVAIRRSESNRRSKAFKDYESSTVSESDSETVRAEMIEYRKNHPRRVNRGPPPPPPVQESIQLQATDVTIERKSPSRHSSISPIRKRKSSKASEEREGTVLERTIESTTTITQCTDDVKEKLENPGIFARIFGKTKKSNDRKLIDDFKDEPYMKNYSWAYIKMCIRVVRLEWIQFKQDHQREIIQIRVQRNRCVGNFILLAMLLGFGGLAFRFTEGNTDGVYKCEIKKVKRDFIDQLWLQSHNMREEDWKSLARNRLRIFEEELSNVYDTGPSLSYTGLKAWGFLNSIIYCWTIVTQIGYGHISPKTTLGQAITIVYAIFGIPIFLILLADFGKLFTRGIKFLWAYVRRVYYTGTCRQMRKSQQMQDVMKGVNTVYDVAIRRPSQFIRDVDIENLDKNESEAADTLPETPTSPYPETLEIDDDFNLPVSVATVILVCYIIVGAFVYPLWEVKWSYFEAFYFVFISMSTIGFGDYVPDHPIFMMLSTVYLVFGLALTSMFINVVQIKLSDSFRQASAKIGATIGFSMTEEELSKHSQLGTPVPAAGLNNIPEENDLEDKEVSNITGSEPVNNADSNAPPPLLPPRQPRIPPDEPKKKKSFF